MSAEYRKAHVAGAEAAWCSPGAQKPPAIDLPLGRVGLLLGADLCFPELPRSLAIAGCDLLAVAAGAGLPPPIGLGPTAIPLHAPGIVAADPRHFHLARQRAFENNCYLAFASLPAPDGIGHSAVFGPDAANLAGATVLDAGASGATAGTIDTSSSTVRAKDLVRTRQTQLYDALQTRQPQAEPDGREWS